MTTPLTNSLTLQRIASMTFLSLQHFFISTARSIFFGHSTGVLSIVVLCCFTLGCTNSEAPVAGDEAITPNSTTMVAAASEVTRIEEPLSVPVGAQMDVENPRLKLSAPDATLTPIAKRRFKPGGSLAPAATEPPLQIGDPAPELRVQHWVHDRTVRSADQSTPIQVITFWATWSEPSVAAVERLPLLRTRFGDDIEIIGVSDETPEALHGFLNSPKPNSAMRWKDHLTVALAADHRGETEGTFLLAGYEQGLPTSFVINREGIIAWIGPADQCEPVVAKVLAEDWDVAAARKAHQWSQFRTSAQRDVRDRLALARVSNDGEECVRLIDGLLEHFPNDVEFQMLRLQYLLRFEMTDAANQQSAALLNQLQDDSLRLNQLAWTLAENSALAGLDLSTALSAAERAVELTAEADSSSLETLARVRFRRGETAEAIEAQSMALQLAPENKTLADTLEAFRKSTASPVRKAGFYGSLM